MRGRSECLRASAHFFATLTTKFGDAPCRLFIAVAVAEKVGVIETAREFLEGRAGKARPKDLLKYLRKAGREEPTETDRR